MPSSSAIRSAWSSRGIANALPVTLDEMIYHTRCVVRGTSRALVVADLPFMTFQVSPTQALESAGRLVKEGGAHAVKLEGGERTAEAIAAIVRADIPVMGHVGLTPQSVHRFGGFKVQRQSEQLLADAKAVEQAGAFAVVVECVPSGAGGEDHRVAVDPDDRHRRRPALRRPGAGRPRHARAVRRPAAASSSSGTPESRRRRSAQAVESVLPRRCAKGRSRTRDAFVSDESVAIRPITSSASISVKHFTTRSAPAAFSFSRDDGPTNVTATHFMPPAFAASTPATASSNTTHRAGGTPSFSAATRNTCGSGLPRCVSSMPTIASK